jgi:UDP-N-acetylmuramate: L-alanyl-gamma-D-glutamyl-meso-diaminopimelate ligase
VVEADEYDTAFFDKRAKFVHYRPRIAILNNLEFDHADIYPDLKSIQTQFHHLVRTIPGNGTIVVNGADAGLAEVLERGCWSRKVPFGLDEHAGCEWQVKLLEPAAANWRSDSTVLRWDADLVADRSPQCAQCHGRDCRSRRGGHRSRPWPSRHCASFVASSAAWKSSASRRHPCLRRFRPSPDRDSPDPGRLASQPSATPASWSPWNRPATPCGPASIVNDLAPALAAADHVWLKTTEAMDWDPLEVLEKCGGDGRPRRRVEALLDDLLAKARPGDHVVFMSNRGFENAPTRFFDRLT